MKNTVDILLTIDKIVESGIVEEKLKSAVQYFEIVRTAKDHNITLTEADEYIQEKGSNLNPKTDKETVKKFLRKVLLSKEALKEQRISIRKLAQIMARYFLTDSEAPMLYALLQTGEVLSKINGLWEVRERSGFITKTDMYGDTTYHSINGNWAYLLVEELKEIKNPYLYLDKFKRVESREIVPLNQKASAIFKYREEVEKVDNPADVFKGKKQKRARKAIEKKEYHKLTLSEKMQLAKKYVLPNELGNREVKPNKHIDWQIVARMVEKSNTMEVDSMNYELIANKSESEEQMRRRNELQKELGVKPTSTEEELKLAKKNVLKKLVHIYKAAKSVAE